MSVFLCMCAVMLCSLCVLHIVCILLMYEMDFLVININELKFLALCHLCLDCYFIGVAVCFVALNLRSMVCFCVYVYF